MSSSLTIKSTISHRKDKRSYGNFRELFITHEGYSEEIPLRLPDLSVQGMFIQTSKQFPEGTVLKVRFRLARSGFEVNARGEVRYCLPGVGIGVEFIEITPEAQNAIEEEMQNKALGSRKS
jgi:PilZ domain